jgi:hypothetical protein
MRPVDLLRATRISFGPVTAAGLAAVIIALAVAYAVTAALYKPAYPPSPSGPVVQVAYIAR